MYEFNKKELREAFKKTELGKKYNLYVIISCIVMVIFFIAVYIIYVFNLNNTKDLTNIQSILITLLFFFFFVSAITACYFDGKRDGAFKQFKLTYKKK